MSDYDMHDQPSLNTTDSPIDSTAKKQTFLDPEKYQLLKSYQQIVFEQTEVSPTLRKLVNALVTKENLDIVIQKIIAALT